MDTYYRSEQLMTSSMVESLFKLGVADYLLKPALDKDELLALMNRLRSASPGIRSHASAAQTLKELLHGGSVLS